MELIAIMLCYCIEGAVETGLCCACYDCCFKRKEQTDSPLTFQEPLKGESRKPIISQKVQYHWD